MKHYLPLSELCVINMGQSPDSSSYNTEKRGLPFFQGNADFGKISPHVRIWCDAPTKIAHAGDLLLSVRAPIGALNIADSDCCIGRGLAAMTCIDKKCDQRWLFFALQSKVAELQSKGTGSTFKAISKKILFDTLLPDYPIAEQREIARNLDSLTRMIFIRKKQMEKLTQLASSRFVEMFGEKSKYPSEPLSRNVEEMFIGPFGSSLKNDCFVAKQEAFCMVYEQKHAIQKTMDVETRYVNESKYRELKRFSVHGGDIIVSCRGTIGEIYVVPDDAPLGIMHPSIMKIRLKSSAYNTIFFSNLLRRYMQLHSEESKGSGVKMAVTATVLGKTHFCIPPITIQNEFASFIEQLDKSKFTIRQSLEKLNLAYKAQLQEYFG